jgi:mannose-6-phosphate isomerase-like protein (cupin superfamily)
VLTIDVDSIRSILGSEGTQIKQILHPHNTMLGIRYSIIHCKVEAGKSSKTHKLKSSEVYFILNGKGIIHVDEQTTQLKKNQVIYIPPYSKQFIQNIGKTPLEFLCIVDPAWRKEDEIVE